jgi:flavodoxin
MKFLVVYYSRHGSTEKVAKKIAKSLKADIEKIEDKKDRSKLVNWFMSASNEELKTPTKIEETNFDTKDYDLVIIGTPIWDGITPPVKEYLKQNKSKLKKVAFFSTFGASAEDAFYQMEKVINKKPIATLELQDREILLKKDSKRIKEFLNEIK